jgi:hypothetical protein
VTWATGVSAAHVVRGSMCDPSTDLANPINLTNANQPG